MGPLNALTSCCICHVWQMSDMDCNKRLNLLTQRRVHQPFFSYLIGMLSESFSQHRWCLDHLDQRRSPLLIFSLTECLVTNEMVEERAQCRMKQQLQDTWETYSSKWFSVFPGMTKKQTNSPTVKPSNISIVTVIK